MLRFLLSLIFLFPSHSFSQTLIQSVDLPAGTYWNSAYGMVYADGKYWISSSSTTGNGIFYAVNDQGLLVDTVTVQNYPTLRASQGLAFDGSDFWYVERKTARCDLFKISLDGTVLDSITSTQLFGASWYMGGAAWDGTGLWVSIYSPDASVAIYKVDVNTKQIVDSIPALQLQPAGVTVKGDTLFYANDGFQGFDHIYAFDINIKNLLFSFNPPEQPGLRQNPRGLAWDGDYFWLLAEPIGASSGRQLFKYDLSGSGTPGINILTPAIGFGNVMIDSTVTGSILIKNYGTADLILDSAVISNTVFNINESFPYTIAPDVTASLQVTFTPTEYIDYTDSVLFYNNDPSYTYSKVTLAGSGVYSAPYLLFNPSAVNYGSKRVASTSYIELELINGGSAQLQIDSMIIGTDNFYFENVNTPIILNALASTTVRVWFNPIFPISYTDSITIHSNASNSRSVLYVPLSGQGINADPVLGNIFWQTTVPPNPGTSFQDLQVRAMIELDDVSGDGFKDLIVCSRNYWTIAYNGNSSGTGDILWKFSTIPSSTNAGSVEWIQNLAVASDLNNDGVNDVVIGTTGGNEFVYALNGLTGEKIWEYGDSINFSNGDIMGVDVKRDWNNDGVPDVLVTASGNESTGQGRFSVILLDGAIGNVIWQINQASQQKLKYMVASTDFGGAAGSRVGTLNEVIGFNRNGQIVWTFLTSGTPWTVREIPNVGGSASSDILVGTTTGAVYVLDGETGQQIWQTSIGSVFIEDARIVPDINSNSSPDILISGINPNIYILDGANGQNIWGNFTGGNILGIGVLTDLSGDGVPEVGSASLNNLAHVFDGRTGNIIFTYAFGGGGNSTAAEHICPVDDVDRNLSFEFAAASRDGRIILFSGGEDAIPVEMTSFTAFVNSNIVTLNWSTATELNNMGFDVERSIISNGVRTLIWEKIGFIDGKGTTTDKSVYSFTDNNLEFGKYAYRLKQIDFNGVFTYSDVIEVEVGMPVSFVLEQNYPNPFNPSTIIKYSVPIESRVKLSIFNTLGEQIALLINETIPAGYHEYEWNGTTNSGNKVSSGIYFYRIETEGINGQKFVNVKKMMMVK
ncbi:MAG: choice-of-anchor D domain-containing protein [Ignavibacterium sp.]|nr:choice-of-anchor D domain-containing protein [Ignavibacterium sp.]